MKNLVKDPREQVDILGESLQHLLEEEDRRGNNVRWRGGLAAELQRNRAA